MGKTKKQKEETKQQKNETVFVRATSKKEAGNEHFKTGAYQRAIQDYVSAVHLLSTPRFWRSATDALWTTASTLYVACQSNRSLCHLKLNEWGSAIRCATDALTWEKSNVKALFRRGSALMERRDAGDLEKAERDFSKAQQLDPENVDAQRKLASCRALLGKEGTDATTVVSSAKKSVTAQPKSTTAPNKKTKSRRAAKVAEDNKEAKLTACQTMLCQASRKFDPCGNAPIIVGDGRLVQWKDVFELDVEKERRRWGKFCAGSVVSLIEYDCFVNFQLHVALDPCVARTPEAKTIYLDPAKLPTGGENAVEELNNFLNETCEIVDDRLNRPRGSKRVIARRAISRGEVIFTEVPVFSFGVADGGVCIPMASEMNLKTKADCVRHDAPKLNAKFAKLAERERDAIRALCDSSFDFGVSEDVGIAGHFYTNGIHARGAPVFTSNLFLAVSRLNSDCNPNCFYKWRESEGREAVIAKVDICEGDDLTVCYVNPRHPKAERQQNLLDGFGFACRCATCVCGPLTASPASNLDDEAIDVEELLGHIGEFRDGLCSIGYPGSVLNQTDQGFEVFNELVDMIVELGDRLRFPEVAALQPDEICEVAAMMARLSIISRSPTSLAKTFARIAHEHYRIAYGDKKEETQLMARWREDPPTQLTAAELVF